MFHFPLNLRQTKTIENIKQLMTIVPFLEHYFAVSMLVCAWLYHHSFDLDDSSFQCEHAFEKICQTIFCSKLVENVKNFHISLTFIWLIMLTQQKISA